MHDHPGGDSAVVPLGTGEIWSGANLDRNSPNHRNVQVDLLSLALKGGY